MTEKADQPFRVLVVDDDDTWAFLLSHLMDRVTPRHMIDAVGTIEAGRSMLTHHEWHVALVDYRLPDGSGIDLVADARCPVILLTGFRAEELAGVDLRGATFVSKDDTDKLIALLCSYLTLISGGGP